METEVNRPPKVTALPKPEPIEALPVEFQVIRQGDGALFCLTPQGYENLSKTQADTLRWVQEAKWRLDYYERELRDQPAADSDPEEAN